MPRERARVYYSQVLLAITLLERECERRVNELRAFRRHARGDVESDMRECHRRRRPHSARLFA